MPDPAGVSHASAAALHGIGNRDADVLEFTLAGRKQSRQADVRIHRGVIPQSDWTQVLGLPVTTLARTVADLVAAGLDGGHLAGLARDAIFSAGVDLQELGSRLAPFAARYGAPVGEDQAFVRRLLDEAGIPAATEQLVQDRALDLLRQLYRQPNAGCRS